MKLSWETCFKAAVTIFGLYLAVTYWGTVGTLFSNLLSAASPLIIGCVIAYLVNILMSFYEKHWFPASKKPLAAKTRRPVCMIGAFLTLIAIVAIVVGLVVPELVSCVSIIIAAVTDVVTLAASALSELEIIPEDILNQLSAIDWQSRIGQILNTLLSGVGSVMDVVISMVSTVFSGVVTGLMALIFAI